MSFHTHNLLSTVIIIPKMTSRNRLKNQVALSVLSQLQKKSLTCKISSWWLTKPSMCLCQKVLMNHTYSKHRFILKIIWLPYQRIIPFGNFMKKIFLNLIANPKYTPNRIKIIFCYTVLFFPTFLEILLLFISISNVSTGVYLRKKFILRFIF